MTATAPTSAAPTLHVPPTLWAMTERTARTAAAAGLAVLAGLGAASSHRPTLVALAVTAAVAVLAAVLAWQPMTGWPLVAALTLATGGVVALGHAQSSNLVWMAACLVAGWVAFTSGAAPTLTVGAVLGLTLVGEWAQQTEESGWAAWLVGTALVAVAGVFARRLRTTVEELRHAQHQLAERTRVEERSRIAGEMHDVIGHALTVSVLHISSARLALEEDLDEARASLDEAERLTRRSLEEVRATVGLMRTRPGAAAAPLPGATDIPALVDTFRLAGAEVDLEVTGELDQLGAAKGLAAYRIVQEALTNATRHAPGEPVDVRVAVVGPGATIAVHNGGAADAEATPGAGLAGMRDRAEGLGGWLSVGVPAGRPHGDGWHVEAVLP